MSYGELALRTGLSVRTLKRMVATQRVPHIRFGAYSVRFDRAAIEQWITDQTRMPEGKGPTP